MTHMPMAAARTLTVDLLRAAGVGDSEAAETADALLFAETWGIPSHGLIRLPWYLRRLSAGGIDPRARMREVRAHGATVAFDGEAGLGHWQAWRAAHAASDLARQHGVGVASVANSNHCGSLGVYVLPMLRAGFVGLVFSNGPAVMPPWGGKDALLSTSPIAAGIPCGEGNAIIDLALSAVARGKIFARAVDGEPIPEGWALDEHGAPTVDAQEALRGMLAPLGGAKGFALAFMVEGLAGGVVGPSLSGDVVDMFDADRVHEPQGIGHLFLAMDPSTLDGDGKGEQRRRALADRVGRAGGRIPGGRRAAVADDERPVWLPPNLISALAEWTEQHGIDVQLPTDPGIEVGS
jgi:(2R)-3-sulfolactate dehydrogenase (NADP+)